VQWRPLHDLIDERDDQVVDAQVRGLQALVRVLRVVVGTRSEQEPAVGFRGGDELLREIAADAAQAGEDDDERRGRRGIARHRIRHEQEWRALVSGHSIDDGRAAYRVYRLPAPIERGREREARGTDAEPERQPQDADQYPSDPHNGGPGTGAHGTRTGHIG